MMRTPGGNSSINARTSEALGNSSQSESTITSH